MSIITAIVYLAHGYRIYRASKGKKNFITKWMANDHPCFLAEDITAKDWEVLFDGLVSEYPTKYQDDLLVP